MELGTGMRHLILSTQLFHKSKTFLKEKVYGDKGRDGKAQLLPETADFGAGIGRMPGEPGASRSARM